MLIMHEECHGAMGVSEGSSEWRLLSNVLKLCHYKVSENKWRHPLNYRDPHVWPRFPSATISPRFSLLVFIFANMM